MWRLGACRHVCNHRIYDQQRERAIASASLPESQRSHAASPDSAQLSVPLEPASPGAANPASASTATFAAARVMGTTGATDSTTNVTVVGVVSLLLWGRRSPAKAALCLGHRRRAAAQRNSHENGVSGLHARDLGDLTLPSCVSAVTAVTGKASTLHLQCRHLSGARLQMPQETGQRCTPL